MGWLTRKIGRVEHAARRAHGRHRKRIWNLANRLRQRIVNLTAERAER